jgi:hypothetical protein
LENEIMNRPSYRTSTSLAVTTIVLALSYTGPLFGSFRAAIAVRDVTPEKPLPVSGGVGPSHPTTKMLGRLTVRALILENGNTRVALCSTDFLGFPGILCDKVHRQVTGIPAEHILIGATHNHSGPDCYGFPNETGQTSCDLDYLDGVCAALADAINEATGKLQPATLKIATGKARGRIAYNYYAERLYDPRCHVVQMLDAQSRPFATLVNYACHPEVIGADQGILSPDFVGPLYDRIKAQGGGTGIFMNGALGGMVTADCRGPDGRDIQTWDECIRIGHLLADEALRIVAGAPIQDEPGLSCHSRTVTLPVENDMLRTVVKMSPLGFEMDDAGNVRTRLNVVNLGNAQILTIPGEAMPNIGYYLKRNMQGQHNFLFGLTNDAFGYILAKVDWNSFERYSYITRTCLGEMTGEILMKEALTLVEQATRPAR